MSADIDALEADLQRCMLRDRRPLQRRIAGLRKRAQKRQPVDRGVREIGLAIAASRVALETRRARCPAPTFPESLPVSAKRREIADAIVANQVVVICGETGSGKTTQLPKICLDLGLGLVGVIGHTQPRRIAARSVAKRIAEELGSPIGRDVGFKVRFSDRTSVDSYVKLMTDGILLAEIQQDPWLDQYDTIIIDEAHERSLNIDFLLGYLKRLLARRPDLKLIITSATIDPERFSRQFGGAPIVNVSGRTYPVEVRYRSLVSEDPERQDRDQTQGILDAVDELASLGPGDVLVFLPGERQIRDVAEALRKHHPPGTEILPLYARLSAIDQDRVFKAHGGRRIVLATNVAETSLTVPGIRYVIDPGYVRMSRYSVRSKIQRLPIEPISQASAEQRKGRCGRVAEGVCIRLYAREDFDGRPAFTDPEILRTNLASVILRMESLGLGDIEAFPFVDPPESRQIGDGYKLLEELGGVDGSRRITEVGRQLSRLPVDPRLGRMLLAAHERACLIEVLVIVSALSIQDPRERPLDSQQAADAQHARFRDERSDFLSLWNLWLYLEEQTKHRSGNQFRKLCRREYLSYMRVREWRDLERQLRVLVNDMGLRPNQEPSGYDAIHRALLAGLLGNVGVRVEGGDYLGARNRQFSIFPGSGVGRMRPKWVVAAELVETARLFARNVAKIDVSWVEELAPHLLKRSYSNPRWEKKSARVVADLQLTLYGLIVVPKRSVNYGPVNPAEARAMFIREALVVGEFDTKAPFFHHNRALIEELEELESKSRRRDVLVDEETLFHFYSERIPADVWDGRRFETWHKGRELDDPDTLFLTRDHLMRRDAGHVSSARYPDVLHLDDMGLPLAYHFEPGDENDGVTVRVPLAGLNQIDAEPFEWLVPGLLEEKMTAMIRGLPKALRRNFVPAPEFARVCAESLAHGVGSLSGAMRVELRRMTGLDVPPDAWDTAALPDHLRMRFQVVDVNGTEIAAGRDLSALKAPLAACAAASFGAIPSSEFEGEGFRDWEFRELPERVEIRRGGLRLPGYPALVEARDSVSLKLMDRPEKAAAATRAGVRKLITLQLAREVDHLRAHLPGIAAMCLQYSTIGRCEDLKRDLVQAAVDLAFLDRGVPRSRESFEACIERGRGRLRDKAEELCKWVGRVLEGHRVLAGRLKGAVPVAKVNALADAASQLERLVYRGFVVSTPEDRWNRIPVYLKAMDRRLDRLDQDPSRDRERMLQVQPLWRACVERLDATPDGGKVEPALEAYRWMLEEYRVSLFAQELGTEGRISEKRLARQWAEVA